ncbi:PIN domain-containing protein [Brevibacillus sp. 179-C9.3 HS]|uniref:PIN domain-containing protein n=1 Tax=unclassified Brevibacillus TaxID=2684853 RepID=UPI0039A0D68C
MIFGVSIGHWIDIIIFSLISLPIFYGIFSRIDKSTLAATPIAKTWDANEEKLKLNQPVEVQEIVSREEKTIVHTAAQFPSGNTNLRLIQGQPIMSSSPIDIFLAVDTNVLMEYPTFISGYRKVLLSKVVYRELDMIKKDQGERGRKAQVAFNALEVFQRAGGELVFTTFVDNTFLNKHNLNPNSPDELIIGGVLKAQEEGKNILFFSLDKGV